MPRSYGVTSANVDEMKKGTDNPEVKRMLGTEGDLGSMLGLDNDLGLQRHQAGRQLRRNLRAQHRPSNTRSAWSAA